MTPRPTRAGGGGRGCRWLLGALATGLLVAACGSDAEPPPPTTTTVPAPPTTAARPPLGTLLPAGAPDPAAPEATSTSDVASTPDATGAPEPTGPAVPAGPVYELGWDRLRHPPFYGYDDRTDPDDPFWHLHTHPDEAFWFSLELYTTGFGATWTGGTGTVALGCGAELSGICLHLDPDGRGGDGAEDLNADFRATGTVRIDRLDEGGYDLTLHDVRFTDGSTLPGPTRLRGSP